MVEKSMKLSLREKELLSEEVQLYPCLYDKTALGHKEKDVIANSWNKLSNKLEFIKNVELWNYIFTNNLFWKTLGRSCYF